MSQYPTGPGTPRLHDADLTSLLAELRDARFPDGVACPRCRSRRAIRWGRFTGRQRYRCPACKRTFSDLTATPAAYLKHLDRLPAYRDCMRQSLSIRASARSVSVHPTTAFRWRHRLLSFARSHDLSRLSGIVEIEEFWLPRYEPRAHSHGERRDPPSIFARDMPRAWLLVLCDRTGHSWIDYVSQFRPNRACVSRILDMCVEPTAILVTRLGPLSVHAISARGLGMKVRQVRPATNDLLTHTRNARQRILRLRRWLRPFRGVKPDYLWHYFAWSEMLDPHRCGPRIGRLLDWPIVPIAQGGIYVTPAGDDEGA